MRAHFILLFSLIIAAFGCSDNSPSSGSVLEHTESTPSPAPAQSSALVVYSSSHGAIIKPVLDAYKAETGNNFQLLVDDSLSEPSVIDDPSELPDADVYVVNSFAELAAFAEADTFRPVTSTFIAAQIPELLRDSESRWVALSKRARVVVRNTAAVDQEAMDRIVDYTSLGDDEWEGKLCLSSSKNAGNQLLVSFLIDELGVRNAELAVRKWRENFAAPPFSNDRDLIAAIASGQCEIGIVDSNILLQHVAANQNAPIEPLVFMDDGNTLFDISGAGVSRHAHNAEDAVAFLEWISSPTPNALYAAQDREIPANQDAPRGIAPPDWTDELSVENPLTGLGFLQEDAIKLVERARYP